MPQIRTRFPLFPSRLAACASLALLAACGSAPPANISLPAAGSPQATASASIGDVKTQRIEWKGVKPGCTGECPTIEIDSVAFPDIPKLSQAVDHILASLTGVDSNLRGQYDTLSEYTQYFWRNAQGRDATLFKASVKDVAQGVVSVELHTSQYFTGAAHGIPATLYLNWQLAGGRLLRLDDLLIPGRRPGYVQALQQAHQKWLAGNETPSAIRQPTTGCGLSRKPTTSPSPAKAWSPNTTPIPLPPTPMASRNCCCPGACCKAWSSRSCWAASPEPALKRAAGSPGRSTPIAPPAPAS